MTDIRRYSNLRYRTVFHSSKDEDVKSKHPFQIECLFLIGTDPASAEKSEPIMSSFLNVYYRQNIFGKDLFESFLVGMETNKI